MRLNEKIRSAQCIAPLKHCPAAGMQHFFWGEIINSEGVSYGLIWWRFYFDDALLSWQIGWALLDSQTWEHELIIPCRAEAASELKKGFASALMGGHLLGDDDFSELGVEEAVARAWPPAFSKAQSRRCACEFFELGKKIFMALFNCQMGGSRSQFITAKSWHWNSISGGDNDHQPNEVCLIDHMGSESRRQLLLALELQYLGGNQAVALDWKRFKAEAYAAPL